MTQNTKWHETNTARHDTMPTPKFGYNFNIILFGSQEESEKCKIKNKFNKNFTKNNKKTVKFVFPKLGVVLSPKGAGTLASSSFEPKGGRNSGFESVTPQIEENTSESRVLDTASLFLLFFNSPECLGQ